MNTPVCRERLRHLPTTYEGWRQVAHAAIHEEMRVARFLSVCPCRMGIICPPFKTIALEALAQLPQFKPLPLP